MKYMQAIIFRMTTLLAFSSMFCATSAYADYEFVEPTYGYTHTLNFSSLGEARTQIISEQTNGTMASDYWTYGGIVPYDQNYTVNGNPKLYYVQSFPTDKAIKELHVAPGMYKVEGAAIFPICPAGFSLAEGSYNGNLNGPDFYAFCYKPVPCDCDQGGDPIIISSGTLTESAVDYHGAPGLDFVRTYRSDRQGWANNYAVTGFDASSASTTNALKSLYAQLPCVPGIDTKFGSAYCFPQVSPAFAKLPGTIINEFILIRGHDRMKVFGNANNLNPAANINDRVTKLVDGTGATTGWSVYNAGSDATEYFDMNGKLIKVVERNGLQKTLLYSDTTTAPTIAPGVGFLLRVTNNFGQQLNFTYDSNGRMLTMTDPAGGVTSYTYDEASSIVVSGQAKGNLTSVTYPDGKKRVYWYNEQDKTNSANLPLAMTGITDENGARYTTWTYDAQGHAISSEHATGIEKNTFNGYGANENPTHTDPLGVSIVHIYSPVLNEMKLFNKVRHAGADVVHQDISYDSNGNIATLSEYNGIGTQYTYDLTRNLETQRISAYGTTDAQTTTTSWHPNFRIPVQINAPLLRTSFTHDAKGNILTKTLQATSDANGSQGANASVVGSALVWSNTYNDVGQILTKTGPRTDVVDKTTYTYDGQGNLSSITNAAGHVTTMTNYDGNGKVGQITDPNGMVTTLTYLPRGWLSQVTTSGDGTAQTTHYDYDGVGQMTKVTLPDNSSINYSYDDAHRLNRISDNLGNSINYTLDTMGNRINETVTDGSGTLARQVNRVYDILNRLQKVTGATQ